MGTNVSKQSTTVINETITDQSTRIMNKTDMYTESNVMSSQDMDVTVEVGESIGCNWDFIQNMKVKSRVYSKIDEKKQAEITKELTSKLKNEIQNKVDQELKDLNLFQTNVSDIENYTKNYDYHDLSLRVSNALAVRVNSAINANQNQKVSLKFGKIDCTKGEQTGVKIAQNIDVENIVENVVSSEHVSNAVNDFSKDVDSLVVNETKQKATGINPMMFLLFLLIIPMVIVIGVLMFKGIMPGWPKFGASKSKYEARKDAKDAAAAFGNFFGFKAKKRRRR